MSASPSAYVGVGLQVAARDTGLVVNAVQPGGPAEGKVQASDVILEIDGRQTAGLSAAEGAALLKGPQNSPVSVLISRSGTESRVEIMRGIAGKAAQGAAAAVVSSVTPAAAAKSGADAVRELLQLSGSSDWEYYQDSDNVAVFTMPPREGIPYRSVMGRGSITCAGGLATFLPLINGVSNINKWDHKFQQGRELEKLSEQQSIYYAAYSSGVPMVIGRDFTFLETREMFPDGSYVCVGVSVEHALAPSASGYVRGSMLPSGWILKPLKGNEWDVFYIAQINPMGWLPPSVVNAVCGDAALSIAALRKLL